MKTLRPGRPKADPNRDLRAALLASSQQLLDEGGPSALSMREVARRVGCTHQAPYHYFENREAILAELVADGFEDLGRRMKQINDRFEEQGLHATVLASGAAYVGFARARPGVFRVMFRPDMCDPARFPALEPVADGAYAELLRLAGFVQRAVGAAMLVERKPGRDPGADTVLLANLLWAQVHGLACLVLDGPLIRQFETEGALQAHLDALLACFASAVTGAGRG